MTAVQISFVRWRNINCTDGDDFDVLQEIWATDDRFLDSKTETEVIPTIVGKFQYRRSSQE